LLFLVNVVKSFFRILGVEIQRKGTGSTHANNILREKILFSCGGVVHVGAHHGQEAHIYNRAGAKVLWFEAIPDVYQILRRNLKKYKNQEARLALLGDREESVIFHLADNTFQSSSIYELAEGHRFPVSMGSNLNLRMRRLDTILTPEDARSYPHWVIDTQGAELLVLRGAGTLLDEALTLDVEVSSYKTYEGGAQLLEIESFLREKGFAPAWNFPPNSHGNLIFIRTKKPGSNELTT
jgi:FkbM family methyltransferase